MPNPPRAAGVLFTAPAPGAIEAVPTADGGMHVLDDVANVRTYDRGGALVGDIAAFPDKPR